MKLIWLTDLHFSTAPLYGVDTAAFIDAALGHVNAHYGDADLCIVSGDLVDKGEPQEYELLRRKLDTLSIPWYPMVGNHDNRAHLRQYLALPDNTADEFVQYVLSSPAHDIICLDTLREGHSEGEICNRRLEWLITQIEVAADKPVYVFMHHPPMMLDLPMQDRDSFRDREKFLQVLTRYSNVKYIFTGHVHRAVCGQIAGIPYATMRSVSIQAPAPVPQWTWDSFAPADEAPNYGVVSLNGDAANIQFIEF